MISVDRLLTALQEYEVPETAEISGYGASCNDAYGGIICTWDTEQRRYSVKISSAAGREVTKEYRVFDRYK